MDDTDLDKYLEDLGIDMTEGSETVLPGEFDGSGEQAARDDEDERLAVDRLEDEGLEDEGVEDEGLEDEGLADDHLADERFPDEGIEDQSPLERASSSRPVTISVAPLEGTSAERCETFLVDVLLNFDPSYAVEVREEEDELQVEVYGGDPGKVIGRNGRTLAALEFITNAVINREEGTPHTRVSIDVGGYKRRRDERLRNEANKAAARVRKTGYAVELDTMTAAERRVVHMALADVEDVVSESHGEGKNRRVVVKPA